MEGGHAVPEPPATEPPTTGDAGTGSHKAGPGLVGAPGLLSGADPTSSAMPGGEPAALPGLGPPSLLGDYYDLPSEIGLRAGRVLGGNDPPPDRFEFLELRPDDLTSSGHGFEIRITFQGESSNVLVHLPPKDHPGWQTGFRVVPDYHGFFLNPRAHAKMTGNPESLVKLGAIVLCPGGSRTTQSMPLLLARSHTGIDHPIFETDFKAVNGLDLLQYRFQALKAGMKVYTEAKGLPMPELIFDDQLLTGFSNGGAVSIQAAALGHARLAVSFSGPIAEDTLKFLKEAEPGTSVIFVTGSDDLLVPSEGGGLSRTASAEQAALALANRHGHTQLDGEIPEFLWPFMHDQVEIRSAGSLSEGLSAWIHIRGHGHAYPGAQASVLGSDGKVIRRIEGLVGANSTRALSGHELVKAAYLALESISSQ